MRTAGIVCEFDPFHNGHKYLIDTVRSDPEIGSVVCVMSGNFVQRGMPANFDKFARAKAAVSCGADLVLELPALYAVNSADYFARGAVRILKGLGCVSDIAFGSESGDYWSLHDTAVFLTSEDQMFSERLKDILSKGVSYPAALSEAFNQVSGLSWRTDLSGPNDILGVCYLKENIVQEAGMMPYPVKRIGPGHDSADVSGEFASASEIRRLYTEGRYSEAEGFIPDRAMEYLKKDPNHPDEQLLFRLLQSAILNSDTDKIARALEVSEGLENRIVKAVLKADSFESLVTEIKTKRYPRARICRALMQILLGLDKDTLRAAEEAQLAYAKVLAFNGKGAEILKLASEQGSIPVYSNINKNVKNDAPEKMLLDIDIKANDIYSVLCGRSVLDYSDKVRVPMIMKS